MELSNGKITILIGQEGTTIELRDGDACTVFATVKLTNDQLASAFSRLAGTSCSIELRGLDRVGKTHESQSFSFEINEEMERNNPALNQACLKALSLMGMSEWVPDKHYGSQGSFFSQDGKRFARTTIRRWI